MSIRLEENGLVLRLFSSENAARSVPGVVSVLWYRMGWIAKTDDGRWMDNDGILPINWQPDVGP